MQKNILLLISLLLFVSCSSDTANLQKQTNSEPSWLFNPQTTSKLAAVGCAQIHINGIHAQKKLAISRAIEQIALQKNAKVDVITYRKKTKNGASMTSRVIETSSVQESHTNIQTIVKDFYTNHDKEICTWVQER
ncbi:MAG: hypothetical protein HRT40_01290 [Campylobacteraceae bacterium]|nr:hypothetical protein [Campylobacteraceae bacterium]